MYSPEINLSGALVKITRDSPPGGQAKRVGFVGCVLVDLDEASAGVLERVENNMRKHFGLGEVIVSGLTTPPCGMRVWLKYTPACIFDFTHLASLRAADGIGSIGLAGIDLSAVRGFSVKVRVKLSYYSFPSPAASAEQGKKIQGIRRCCVRVSDHCTE
jgi:hypothetical protein